MKLDCFTVVTVSYIERALCDVDVTDSEPVLCLRCGLSKLSISPSTNISEGGNLNRDLDEYFPGN